MNRCRAYFYGRGIIQYRHGHRCELSAGHAGQHRAMGHFLDPRAEHVWGREVRK